MMGQGPRKEALTIPSTQGSLWATLQNHENPSMPLMAPKLIKSVPKDANEKMGPNHQHAISVKRWFLQYHALENLVSRSPCILISTENSINENS